MKGSQHPTIRAVRGPITLITLGILFAVQNFTPYGFDQTWPVLLIVFGVLTLLGRTTAPPLAGPPPPVPPYAAPPYPPNYGWQPPAGASGRGSSYTQSTYAQPAPDAAGPAKGGFGTSAPPRGSENPPEGSTPGGSL
jgi:hypothetical protein